MKVKELLELNEEYMFQQTRTHFRIYGNQEDNVRFTHSEYNPTYLHIRAFENLQIKGWRVDNQNAVMVLILKANLDELNKIFEKYINKFKIEQCEKKLKKLYEKEKEFNNETN